MKYFPFSNWNIFLFLIGRFSFFWLEYSHLSNWNISIFLIGIFSFLQLEPFSFSSFNFLFFNLSFLILFYWFFFSFSSNFYYFFHDNSKVIRSRSWNGCRSWSISNMIDNSGTNQFRIKSSSSKFHRKSKWMTKFDFEKIVYMYYEMFCQLWSFEFAVWRYLSSY